MFLKVGFREESQPREEKYMMQGVMLRRLESWEEIVAELLPRKKKEKKERERRIKSQEGGGARTTGGKNGALR